MRLEGDSWRTFFDSYRREAFRLETLPSYHVGGEQEEYEKFLATGQLDIPNDDSWLTRVRHFRNTGRWIGRVHVISRPLTGYLRYEFAVYRRTVAAEVVSCDTGQPSHDRLLPPSDHSAGSHTLADSPCQLLVHALYLSSGRESTRMLRVVLAADLADFSPWSNATLIVNRRTSWCCGTSTTP
ncbi:MAG: DUF6879 family protein [Pseudonocardiaceae bacterium]